MGAWQKFQHFLNVKIIWKDLRSLLGFRLRWILKHDFSSKIAAAGLSGEIIRQSFRNAFDDRKKKEMNFPLATKRHFPHLELRTIPPYRIDVSRTCMNIELRVRSFVHVHTSEQHFQNVFFFRVSVFLSSYITYYILQRFQYKWTATVQRPTSKWRLSIYKMYASTKSNEMLFFFIWKKRRERQRVCMSAYGGCFLNFTFFVSFSFDEAIHCNFMALLVALNMKV